MKPTLSDADRANYDHVTAILDAWLDPGYHDWVVRVGRSAASRVSAKARKVGSRGDELIRDDLDKGKFKLRKADPKEVVHCMNAWSQWYKGNPVVSHHVRSWDDELRVTGEYDLEGETALIDVKAGARIYPRYWLQVAKYNAMSGLNKPKIAILRLDPFWGTPDYVDKPHSDGLVRVFDAMLVVSRYFKVMEDQDAS